MRAQESRAARRRARAKLRPRVRAIHRVCQPLTFPATPVVESRKYRRGRLRRTSVANTRRCATAVRAWLRLTIRSAKRWRVAVAPLRREPAEPEPGGWG